MEWSIDPLTAKVIAALTGPARRRLDSYLLNAPGDQRLSGAGYRAVPGEMPDIEPGVWLHAAMSKGRPVMTVELDGRRATWSAHVLTLRTELPDTVVAAMRNRDLGTIVDHALLRGVVVSSARRLRGVNDVEMVIVETKRRPEIKIADIVSEGIERPVDPIEALRALGIHTMCRVATNILDRLSPAGVQALIHRLSPGVRSLGVMDLFGYPPSGLTSLSLHIKEGSLTTTALFFNGRFETGRMICHGTPASRATCFSSGLFPLYRGIGPGNHIRAPRNATISLDDYVAAKQKRLESMRIAA